MGLSRTRRGTDDVTEAKRLADKGLRAGATFRTSGQRALEGPTQPIAPTIRAVATCTATVSSIRRP